MERSGIPEHLSSAIRSLYDDSRIVIKTPNTISEEVKINKGLRQGCSLSPTLFNIYIKVVNIWMGEVEGGIKLRQGCNVNTMLFADDQIVIQTTEDDLQLSIFQLDRICKEYGLQISINKTKIMAFKGKWPVRSKIVLNNCILEQVSKFKYLGCTLTYNKGVDIQEKIGKFQSICGTIHRSLKQRVQRETELKFYKTMAVPILDIWK